MITLRPHQVNAIKKVDDALIGGSKAVMCVLPTGSGKSLTLAEYANRAYQKKEICIIFAHRDVLISQLSEALCKTGVPHTFICSDKARRDITNNNLTLFGDSYWEDTSTVVVSSTPTFNARLRDGKLNPQFLEKVRWWMQDECFPAGTLVDGKPIELLSVGDYVTSLNESTGEFEKKKIKRVFRHDAHDTMCVIYTTDGTKLVCTLNHPVYTKRGWVPAFLLTSSDKVLKHEQSFLSHVWERGGTEYSKQEVLTQAKGEKLLFNGVLVNVPFSSEFCDDGEYKQEVCVGKDEEKQSNVKPRLSEKNERDTENNSTQTVSKGWQRKTSDRSRGSALPVTETPRVHSGNSSENGTLSSPNELSSLLQSGCRKQQSETGDRSGWVQSLCSEQTGSGQKKRVVSYWVGVDSVEVYERTDTDGDGERHDYDYVYNLEVEGNHNYVANGVLVHNCHHTISGNQWHTCLASMPNARGIGFTATPIRGDKKGLGSHADGIFDYLSCTVGMWDLIQTRMLAPYKIFAHGRIDVTGIKKDKNGDLNTKQLRIKTKEADITGDAVEQYRKHLNGKPVITFCINIEHAKEVAAEFIAAGVPSVAVSSKQPLAERQKAMDDMKEGRILNLVNVDLLGEGYDCPAVAGVIMMRRTVSYSLFKQQFGRMLRLSPGKLYGVLIDMVSNTRYMMETFGLKYPHDDPTWTLDRLTDKKPKPCPECGSEKFYEGHCRDCGFTDDEPQYESMECPECGAFGVVGSEPVADMLVFIDGYCPECGHKETEEEKVARVRQIKVQAGDLEEQTFDVVEELLAKREAHYAPVTDFAQKLPDHLSFKRAAVNNHATRQSNLDILRHWIQKWSEMMWDNTRMSPALIQAEFELTFGVNVLRCQAEYTASEMDKLRARIEQQCQRTQLRGVAG